jgi:hypothetical protein
MEPNSFPYMQEDYLLLATSTPTYKNIATIPNTNCGYFSTEERGCCISLASSTSCVSVTLGREENFRNIAAKTKAALIPDKGF